MFDPDYCEKRCPVCTRARKGNRFARFLQAIETVITFGDTRVVDQDRHRAKLGLHGCHQPGRVGSDGDIRLDGDGTTTSPLNRGAGLPGLFLAGSEVHHHVGTGLGQGDGDSPADPPASASDQCDFAGEVVRHGGHLWSPIHAILPCHWALQNQPVGGASKPASWVHAW
jgi:hypothetical protein